MKVKNWTWDTAEDERFIYRKPFFENGRWRCRKIEKATGKIQRITLNASSFRDAKQEIHDLLNAGSEKKIKQISFGDALNEWLKTLDVRKVTYEWHERIADIFKECIGSDKILSEMEYKDIENFFSINARNNKGKTKITYRMHLKRFFEWAIKCGYCRNNLASMIEVQKKWKQEERNGLLFTGKCLSFEEAKNLLKVCKDRKIIIFSHTYNKTNKKESNENYLWLFVLFGLKSGLRRSNLIGSRYKEGLKWKNINLQSGTLHIDKSAMKNGMDFDVPLNDELLQALKDEVAAMGKIPSGEERIFNIYNLCKSFKTCLKKAGIEKNFRIHDLRHTFASWLGEYCPHAIMQKLLAHSPRSITDKYSQHQSIETLREWINKLPYLTKDENKKPSSCEEG